MAGERAGQQADNDGDATIDRVEAARDVKFCTMTMTMWKQVIA
jgi:hypothetical protein